MKLSGTSMTHYILFHLHDNNKGRWLEPTKVIFDVQHQTTYTWRVWHHDDSKLITQQQTSGCCEDKGLASVCFCCSLNQKTQKRKGSHMKDDQRAEKAQNWDSSSHQRRWVTSRVGTGTGGGGCIHVAVQVTPCVSASQIFFSACMLTVSVWHIR